MAIVKYYHLESQHHCKKSLFLCACHGETANIWHYVHHMMIIKDNSNYFCCVYNNHVTYSGIVSIPTLLTISFWWQLFQKMIPKQYSQAYLTVASSPKFYSLCGCWLAEEQMSEHRHVSSQRFWSPRYQNVLINTIETSIHACYISKH